jgi:hypothetical protein
MSERDATLAALRRSAKRRTKAARELEAARDELRQRIAEAQKAGVPITRIAEAAGLSRQAIYDLRPAQPPS